MIKKVTINNFQSHKVTELNLHPGVNVIVGQSDSGKTAIIRALNWVINNRPQGDSFIREGEKICGVTIEKESPRWVMRYKDNKENIYRMGEEIFKSFGSSVPEYISRELNFSDINLQSQMEAPFMLSSSPSQMAKQLNDIIGLDDIDRCISEIRKKKLDVSSRIRHSKEELEKVELHREKYSYLPDLGARIQGAEDIAEELKDLMDDCLVIEELIMRIKACEDDVSFYKIPDIEKLDEVYFQYEKTCGGFKGLETILSSISFLEDEIRICNDECDRLNRELKEISPKECPLCGATWNK
jgi:exonuclease SbcC